MQVHTIGRIGATREVTPNGSLLCRDVAIARTGEMVYGPGQVPVPHGSDMKIRVSRDASEVFRPETMASFGAAPVTINHPPVGVDVDPTNWKSLAVGVTLNPRRGQGAESDFLFADLLITDRAAIDAIQGGKLEISCGYDAAYETLGPGRGRQKNIVGNHVALVDKGRCGPRCAIGDADDSEIPTGEQDMTATTPMQAVRDAIAKACGFKDDADMIAKAPVGTTAVPLTLDAAAIGKAIAEGLAPIAETVAAIQAKMTKDAEGDKEESDEDKAKRLAKEKADKTADAAVDLTAIAARAEILAPGFKLPTHDAATGSVRDHACACQRKALAAAYATSRGRSAIEPFLNGQTADFDKLEAQTLDMVFVGASGALKAANNLAIAAGARPHASAGHDASIPALQKTYDEFWDKRDPNRARA